MATFLSSVAALATLVQAPPPAPPVPSDSLAALRERAARDSTDGTAWLLLGRGLLQLAEEAHGRAHRAEADSAWARAALDTAEAALARAAWRSDALLRARLARDLKLGRRTADDGWLGELAKRRSVCISMAFERPPEVRPRVGWVPRALVWVAGPQGKGPPVPARDFVFAALRVGLDAHDPWADPALAAYARAARVPRALCGPPATVKVSAEVAACRR